MKITNFLFLVIDKESGISNMIPTFRQQNTLSLEYEVDRT